MMPVWSPKQADFLLHSDARLNFLVGAVRSGKTVVSLARWVNYVATAPTGGDLFMIGKSERSLKRNCIIPLQRLVGPKRCVYREGAGELMLGDPGRQRLVYIVGANDARATVKVQGPTAAGLYGDEFMTWPEEFFHMAMSRLTVAGSQAFLTANPDNPNHPIRKQYLLRLDEVRGKMWEFRLADNIHLDPQVRADLESTYVGVFYRRYILGEWVVAEGAVYDQWGPECLVDAVPEGVRRWVVGVDYGTTNPFWAGLIAEGSEAPPNYYVVAERYWDSTAERRQKTDEEYVTDVAGLVTGVDYHAIFADPSAASFLVTSRRAGLRVVGANNDVLDGILTVSRLMAGGRLKVLRGKCPRLEACLDGYRWDPKSLTKGVDRPLKLDDHAADGLRYGLHTLLGPKEGRSVVGPPLVGGVRY